MVDRFSEGMRRLERLRRIPGYGQNVLEKFGSALPQDVYEGERLRLQRLQEQSLKGQPLAYALNMLKNAYEERDQLNIQRWERTLERAGARRYLQRVRAMARKDRPLGYATAGFWQGRQVSGLGG